jgi:hypothetical protein
MHCISWPNLTNILRPIWILDKDLSEIRMNRQSHHAKRQKAYKSVPFVYGSYYEENISDRTTCPYRTNEPNHSHLSIRVSPHPQSECSVDRLQSRKCQVNILGGKINRPTNSAMNASMSWVENELGSVVKSRKAWYKSISFHMTTHHESTRAK